MILDMNGIENIDKIKCIPEMLTTLESCLNTLQFNLYMVTKIKELREMSHIISELVHREEIISSPLRQKSKVKKSRIVFDKQVDLLLMQSAIAKLECSVKHRLQIHTELNAKLSQIDLPDQSFDKPDDLEQLNISRLVSIYLSEVEHLNEYFGNVENHPDNQNDRSLLTLNSSYSDIINDEHVMLIVNYFQNLSTLCNDLRELNSKLVLYEQQEHCSTNAENSRNSSTQYVRSKSQTIELSDQQRKQVLKEITNEQKKEQSSETCINCRIF